MDLEPQAGRPAGQRLRVVIGLEAEPGGQDLHARTAGRRRQALGVSEPLPLGVFIATQVPLGTAFQALPW